MDRVSCVPCFAVLVTSPAGWVYWVSLAASGVGYTTAYLGVMDACFGVHKVMWRYRAGSFEQKADCTFYSNWNYG
jgi:hypothetical protein